MIPGTTNKFATVCCCIPLALFCLLCGICLTAWGAYDAWVASRVDDFPNWSSILVMILAALKGVMGLLGIFAVLFRWTKGASFLIAGYNILFMSLVLTFIIQWVSWIISWSDKNKDFPTHDDVPYMVVFNVLYILFFIASWWICSAFKSFSAVLNAGGSGWERKNYVNIRADRVMSAQGGGGKGGAHDDEV